MPQKHDAVPATPAEWVFPLEQSMRRTVPPGGIRFAGRLIV